MIAEFFAFLDGISPWAWVALALALAVLEMASMTFFLIWPALSALIVAAFLSASPTMSPQSQITIFAGLCIFLTLVGRFMFSRYGDGAEENQLNQKEAQFIGRTGKVLEFSNDHGVIELDGMRWRADWPKGSNTETGAMVRVVAAKGMTLRVENVVN